MGICHSQQGYLFSENQAIQSNYELINCRCEDDCWCKRNGCVGHYRIREIDFDHFLNTYVRLWVPQNSRYNVKNAVLHSIPYNGRQRNAIPHLQWLKGKLNSFLEKCRIIQE